MIFSFRGYDKWCPVEWFQGKHEGDFQFYDWKSKAGPVGFDVEIEGKLFINELFKGAKALFILEDSFKIIEEDNDFSNFGHLIIFWGDTSKVKNEIKLFEEYKIEKKKNVLRERYGKQLKELKIPLFLNAYKDRKYSEAFIEFFDKNFPKYIIAGSMMYGLTLYQPPGAISIHNEVINLCKKQQITLKEVESYWFMPDW